jgi:hypothetical protein
VLVVMLFMPVLLVAMRMGAMAFRSMLVMMMPAGFAMFMRMFALGVRVFVGMPVLVLVTVAMIFLLVVRMALMLFVRRVSMCWLAFMLMAVPMPMLVIVFIAVGMLMAVAMIAIILIVGVRGTLVNAKFNALDALPLFPFEVHVKIADIEL